MLNLIIFNDFINTSFFLFYYKECKIKLTKVNKFSRLRILENFEIFFILKIAYYLLYIKKIYIKELIISKLNVKI